MIFFAKEFSRASPIILYLILTRIGNRMKDILIKYRNIHLITKNLQKVSTSPSFGKI